MLHPLFNEEMSFIFVESLIILPFNLLQVVWRTLLTIKSIERRKVELNVEIKLTFCVYFTPAVLDILTLHARD